MCLPSWRTREKSSVFQSTLWRRLLLSKSSTLSLFKVLRNNELLLFKFIINFLIVSSRCAPLARGILPTFLFSAQIPCSAPFQAWELKWTILQTPPLHLPTSVLALYHPLYEYSPSVLCEWALLSLSKWRSMLLLLSQMSAVLDFSNNLHSVINHKSWKSTLLDLLKREMTCLPSNSPELP